jgi:putative transposase
MATPPRLITPNTVCFVTCQCVGRSFRLLPRRKVVQTVRYALAVVLGKYDIVLHEFEFMSNHYHLVLTDREGRLPDFIRDFNSLVSRSLNAIRGGRGTNFEDGYNIVVPQDDEKLLEHAVYTLANPCSAHLVSRARHWEGVSSLKMKYGVPVSVDRPSFGLWTPPALNRTRDGTRAAHTKPSRLPETANLQIDALPVEGFGSPQALRRHILDRLDTRELELIRERKNSGQRVMGMRDVLKQRWQDAPHNQQRMFGTRPTVSGSSKWARMEALDRRKGFEAEYRECFEAHRAGDRDVVWPHGTWLMVQRHRLPCRPCGPGP